RVSPSGNSSRSYSRPYMPTQGPAETVRLEFSRAGPLRSLPITAARPLSCLPVETSRRWVALDVGETLIDETRVWATWADTLGVPHLTFFAALGAEVIGERDHRSLLEFFGGPDWQAHSPAVEAAYGAFRADDLYPDAIRSVDGLRAAGYRVA